MVSFGFHLLSLISHFSHDLLLGWSQHTSVWSPLHEWQTELSACLSGVFLCSLSLISSSFLPGLGVEWTGQEGR